MDLTLDFHKNHKDWTSRLLFYKDEINFFFKELNKVFDQNKQNLAWMEFIDEYEAILDKKSNKIEDLLNRINEVEKENLKNSEKEEVSKNHHQLHLDFINFEQSFLEMKKRFKRFASRND